MQVFMACASTRDAANPEIDHSVTVEMQWLPRMGEVVTVNGRAFVVAEVAHLVDRSTLSGAVSRMPRLLLIPEKVEQ